MQLLMCESAGEMCTRTCRTHYLWAELCRLRPRQGRGHFIKMAVVGSEVEYEWILMRGK